jgi:H+/gluconate symporter-like permease
LLSTIALAVAATPGHAAAGRGILILTAVILAIPFVIAALPIGRRKKARAEEEKARAEEKKKTAPRTGYLYTPHRGRR